MSRTRPTTIGQLGEERLIENIRRWLGSACPAAPHGIGDDCAVVPAPRGRRQLVTVDPVIYGRHFDDSVAPADVAAKLLKRNLSDIAAMGGTPRHAVLTFAAPPTLRIDWVEAFYRGLARAAKRHGVDIVGGDCAQAGNWLAITLTLTGDAPKRPLLRTGAKPGDLLFVTGTLGGSILGRHVRFVPRLEEGRWLAARPGVHAALDLSDGLGKDLFAIIPPGCRAIIDPGALPVSTAARHLADETGRHILDCVLNDGEDYELLFAASPRRMEDLVIAWHRKFGTKLSCIGRIAERQPGETLLHFRPPLVVGVRPHGYEHFR